MKVLELYYFDATGCKRCEEHQGFHMEKIYPHDHCDCDFEDYTIEIDRSYGSEDVDVSDFLGGDAVPELDFNEETSSGDDCFFETDIINCNVYKSLVSLGKREVYLCGKGDESVTFDLDELNTESGDSSLIDICDDASAPSGKTSSEGTYKGGYITEFSIFVELRHQEIEAVRREVCTNASGEQKVVDQYELFYQSTEATHVGEVIYSEEKCAEIDIWLDSNGNPRSNA